MDMENRVISGYCVSDKGSSAQASTESQPLNMVRGRHHHHHSYDHHRPLSSLSSPHTVCAGPTCNRRAIEVAVATTAAAPATSSSGAIGKTFQPFDISPTTAFKSPGAMAAADMGFPFTWAQWKELEKQAMIYKYMMASIPVPPDLLLPIARSFSTTNPNFSLGNGSVYNLNLGLSSNNKEAEPGRCKRTDGKKWRCSRDVAPHQKYCERHLNRGRPRSRKPVEVPVNPPFNNINKKTRFDNHTSLPNPTLHSTTSSHGLLRSDTIQSDGIPLFLDKTVDNISVSSYKEPSRGFDWTRQELNLIPYTYFGASDFRQEFSEEPLNLTPYTDFGAPEPELMSLDSQTRIETPRGFIDAWSNKDSNTDKKSESSVSSLGNLWPSSLTLSMAMEAGNALDEEMGHIEMGLGVGVSEESELHKPHVSNWLSPVPYVGSAPGGPLAEMLRPSSMAACSESTGTPATRVSSPSEVLQRTLLSLSDSSGCTSPTIAAPTPDIMPYQWLN